MIAVLKKNSLHNVIILCLTISLMQTGIYSWYRVLPSYMRDLGATPQDIGLAFTALTIAYRAPQILGGWLADHYGARLITILGTLLMGILFLFLPMAKHWSSLLIILCIVFTAGALMYPGQLSLLIHSSPTNFHARSIGLFDFATISGYLLGPLLGALLLSYQSYLGTETISLLFVLTGFTYLMMGIIRWLYLKEVPTNPPQQQEQTAKAHSWSASFSYSLTILILSMAGFLVYYMLWDGPFPYLYLEDVYHLSKVEININSTLACVLAMITSLLGSLAIDRIGAIKFTAFMFMAVMTASLLFIIPYFFVHPSSALWPPLWNSFPYGVGYLLVALVVVPVEGYFIAYQKIITSLGSPRRRALWVGFFGSLMGLVPAIGLSLGGYVYASYGLVGPMSLAFLGSFLGLLMAIILMVMQKRSIQNGK
ncbi:MAG: MFS transporter [Oligoflexia bacterium]|nr:MFS transporter [Oligoflexia bacterium]MBF0367391.1 MFS transporter [Oligoflexia bacterium]